MQMQCSGLVLSVVTFQKPYIVLHGSVCTYDADIVWSDAMEMVQLLLNDLWDCYVLHIDYSEKKPALIFKEDWLQMWSQMSRELLYPDTRDRMFHKMVCLCLCSDQCITGKFKPDQQLENAATNRASG